MLVIESSQRNNRLEGTRKKILKIKPKSAHSFCPTKWTVHDETLYSIINNYNELFLLWV